MWFKNGLGASALSGRVELTRRARLTESVEFTGRAGLTCESSGRISYHKNKKGKSEWN